VTDAKRKKQIARKLPFYFYQDKAECLAVFSYSRPW